MYLEQRFWLPLAVCVTGLSSAVSAGQGECGRPNYLRWDGQAATCSPITIFYAPDPSGAEGLFRFTGTFPLAGEISGTGGKLSGPMRWRIDGISIGDADARPFRTNEYYSILLVKDLQALGITLNDGAIISVEYLGEETYDDANLPPGAPTAVAFEGSEIVASNNGQYRPLRQYPAWDTTISSNNASEIEFADTVEIQTTWQATDHDQDVLTGRFYLRRNNELLEAPLDTQKTGDIYHPAAIFSTLGLGTHVIDAAYIGNEGILNVATPITITVKHPRRPLSLSVTPEHAVAIAGSSDVLAICARDANGYPPADFGGQQAAVTIFIDDGSAAAESAPVAAQALAIFDERACAAVDVSGLSPGRYQVSGESPSDARFQSAMVQGQLDIVPPRDKAPDVPVPASELGTGGSAGSSLVLIGPATLASGDPATGASAYEEMPSGLYLQAEIVAADEAAPPPTGTVQLWVNGQQMTSQNLDGSDRPLARFAELGLAPGDYHATLAYTGNSEFAAVVGLDIEFSVDPTGRPVFQPQAGLDQSFASTADELRLALVTNAVNLIEGRPLTLTAFIFPRDGLVSTRGIPTGRLVFTDGNKQLGTIRVHGFRAAIRLPDGLLQGLHDLRVRYEP